MYKEEPGEMMRKTFQQVVQRNDDNQELAKILAFFGGVAVVVSTLAMMLPLNRYNHETCLNETLISQVDVSTAQTIILDPAIYQACVDAEAARKNNVQAKIGQIGAIGGGVVVVSSLVGLGLLRRRRAQVIREQQACKLRA